MKADRCPTWNLACSVAYRRKKCRCTICKAHRAKAERRRLLNRRLAILEREFIHAVLADTHYITDIVEAYNRLRNRKRDTMARQDIWTDERTGRTFIITESRNDDGVYFWTVERNTQPPTRLGHVERHERQIVAITSTVPDGKAERHPVQTVEDGWKLITSGA